LNENTNSKQSQTMNEDILDDIHHSKTKVEVEKEGNLFPFVLLILGLCTLPFFAPFNWSNFILGAFLLLLNFIIIQRKRKTGIIFTGFICIFASIDLIDFFPFELIAFRFDYISTPIFLGSYVLLNEKIFLDFRHKFVQKNMVSSTDNSKIEFFKKRFKNRSTEELKSIIDNPSMVYDAKKAAAELLESKS
jgi:hypothetical protein